jgi:hypothetical protein
MQTENKKKYTEPTLFTESLTPGKKAKLKGVLFANDKQQQKLINF